MVIHWQDFLAAFLILLILVVWWKENMIGNLKIEYLTPTPVPIGTSIGALGVEVTRVETMQIGNINLGDTVAINVVKFAEVGATISLTLMPELANTVATTDDRVSDGGIILP